MWNISLRPFSKKLCTQIKFFHANQLEISHMLYSACIHMYVLKNLNLLEILDCQNSSQIY